MIELIRGEAVPENAQIVWHTTTKVDLGKDHIYDSNAAHFHENPPFFDDDEDHEQNSLDQSIKKALLSDPEIRFIISVSLQSEVRMPDLDLMDILH